MSLGAVRAPSRLGRFYYLLGGTLGEPQLEWVRLDLIGDGWRKRQIIRLSIIFDVIAVIFGLLPGSTDARLSLVLMFVVAGVGMGAATSTRFRNRRLENHGFLAVPPPVNKEDEYLDSLDPDA